MYAFQYHRPQSVADAAKLLAGNGDAKLLAGLAEGQAGRVVAGLQCGQGASRPR